MPQLVIPVLSIADSHLQEFIEGIGILEDEA